MQIGKEQLDGERHPWDEFCVAASNLRLKLVEALAALAFVADVFALLFDQGEEAVQRKGRVQNVDESRGTGQKTKGRIEVKVAEEQGPLEIGGIYLGPDPVSHGLHGRGKGPEAEQIGEGPRVPNVDHVLLYEH